MSEIPLQAMNWHLAGQPEPWCQLPFSLPPAKFKGPFKLIHGLHAPADQLKRPLNLAREREKGGCQWLILGTAVPPASQLTSIGGAPQN